MRMYKSSWESLSLLKEWIQSVPNDPSKAYCQACNIKLCAHRYSVLKHTATKKHQDNYDKFLRVNQGQQFEEPHQFQYKVSQKRMCEIVKSPFENDQNSQEYLLEEAIIEDDALDYNESIDVLMSTTTSPITAEAENIEHEPKENINYDTVQTLINMVPSKAENIEHEPKENIISDTVQTVINMVPSKTNTFEEISEEMFAKNTKKMTDSAEIRTISSHILDTSVGKAAANVEISIYRWENNQWYQLNQSATNDDGRCTQLVSFEEFRTGIYKLHFNVRPYFHANRVESFYPFIEIVIECTQGQHYHVPLLLNPFGYSTYRGT